MKRLVAFAILAFLSAGFAAAQNGVLAPAVTNAVAFHSFATPAPGSGFTETISGKSIAIPGVITANPGDPVPAPRPIFDNSEEPPFQLSLTYQYVRFRSAPFNANLNGVQTSLSYFLNDWFAVEGNVVSAFGTRVFGGDRSKYLLYTGGGRIALRSEKRKWEPWIHALVGGLHMLPQTAAGGKNAFAFQAGGGADLRFTSNFSFRVGGDYVRSQLYSSSQNNFQFGGGVVFKF